MTRETKIGLFIGMGVIILLGVFVSDHLSESQKQQSPSYSEMFKVPPPAQAARPDPAPTGTTAQAVTPTLTVPGQPVPAQPLAQNTATKPDIIHLDITKPREAIVVQGDAPAGRGAFVPVEQPKGPTADEIKRLNDLEQRARQAASGQGSSPTPTTGTGPRYHVVTESDTLSSIARQYYGKTLEWRTIHEANRALIPNPDRLIVGTKLQIPVKDTGVASPGTTATTTTAQAATAPSAGYTVQEGDTLGEIAREMLGSSARWEELLEANQDQIDSPRNLKVGMVLRIPRK